MKNFFLLLLIVIPGEHLAQNSLQILSPDSARQQTLFAKTPEEKFYAWRSLNRYYLVNALFDSTDISQREMFTIATSLNRDSLLVDACIVLGNKHAFRTNYNLGLAAYLKALEYKSSGWRKARTYNLIAYTYANTDNNQLAFTYLQKSDSLGSFPSTEFQKNIFLLSPTTILDKPIPPCYICKRLRRESQFLLTPHSIQFFCDNLPGPMN